MATECIRLGHKVSKSVELRISRVIQECKICKDENGEKYKSWYEMLNYAVMEYWSYGENGDGFGMPRNAFLPQTRPTTFSVYDVQAGQKRLSRVGQT